MNNNQSRNIIKGDEIRIISEKKRCSFPIDFNAINFSVLDSPPEISKGMVYWTIIFHSNSPKSVARWAIAS